MTRQRGARILALGFALIASVALADTTHWEGAIHYEGDTLDVRLHLDEDSGAATLDLPELWYAGEQARTTRQAGGGWSLELPFGMGEFALQRDEGRLVGARDGFSIELQWSPPPPYGTHEVAFGAHAPALGGTLWVPETQRPASAVILVGGANEANRSSWGYRSKADWYARRGVAVLVYDRRPWGQLEATGSMVDFWSHADDLLAARQLLAEELGPDLSSVGVHAGSQGVWVSLIAQRKQPLFDWFVFTGAPAVTPAEQQLQSLVRHLQDDGMAPGIVADALAYQRLYFAVAHRRSGWSELEQAIEGLEGLPWAGYVDQPRSMEDLSWWRRHMNFDPGPILATMHRPMLILGGSRDWVVPAETNLPLFEHYARRAGNARVTTLALPGADHRLETPPGLDASGRWRFFRIHPGAFRAIEGFLAEVSNPTH